MRRLVCTNSREVHAVAQHWRRRALLEGGGEAAAAEEEEEAASATHYVALLSARLSEARGDPDSAHVDCGPNGSLGTLQREYPCFLGSGGGEEGDRVVAARRSDGGTRGALMLFAQRRGYGASPPPRLLLPHGCLSATAAAPDAVPALGALDRKLARRASSAMLRSEIAPFCLLLAPLDPEAACRAAIPVLQEDALVRCCGGAGGPLMTTLTYGMDRLGATAMISTPHGVAASLRALRRWRRIWHLSKLVGAMALVLGEIYVEISLRPGHSAASAAISRLQTAASSLALQA
eukprot:4682481-Prymnesium_polylepis.1